MMSQADPYGQICTVVTIACEPHCCGVPGLAGRIRADRDDPSSPLEGRRLG